MTNTFGAKRVVFADFGLTGRTREITRKAVELARETCLEFERPGRPRFVIGSIGPGTKLPTLGHAPWDELLDSYAEQARGLIEGGADALLVETCQDILQSKSAIVGCLDAAGKRLPRGTNKQALAQFVLTAMEGGVMQARTHVDVAYFDRAVEQLRAHFELLEKAAKAPA